MTDFVASLFPAIRAWLRDFAQQQLASGGAHLPGTDLEGVLPLSDAALTVLLLPPLTRPGLFTLRQAEIRADNRIVLHLQPHRFLIPGRIELRVDPHVRIADALRLRLEIQGFIGALAGLLGNAITLPGGIVRQGREIVLDLGQLLERAGLGALLSRVEQLEVQTKPGRGEIHFRLRVPESTKFSEIGEP